MSSAGDSTSQDAAPRQPRAAHVRLRDDGILEFRYHEGVSISLSDAKEIVAFASELVTTRVPPSSSDPPRVTSIAGRGLTSPTAPKTARSCAVPHWSSPRR